MEFIKEYLKIVSYSLLGLIFSFAAFYLLANLYHYLEIRKDYTADFKNQTVIINIDDSLNKIQRNISTYNPNTYNGTMPSTEMTKIRQNISNCVDSINNEVYTSLKEKTTLTILDVYKLRESYEDKVYNNCIVNNLYWLTTIEDSYPSATLVANRDLTIEYFSTLKNSTFYLKKDLINNSSYFYNTSVASASVKDNTKDGFYEVMEAYTRATNFVLNLSNWFNKEVEG